MTIKTNKTAHAQTILQKAVVLTLTFTILGNHRKVDVNRLVDEALDVNGDGPEPDAGKAADAVAGAENLVLALHGLAERKTLDEKAFGAQKKLIDQKELTPLHRVCGRAKSYLRSRAMPAHRVFGERSYLVPLALVQEVDKTLGEFEAELRAEAEGLRVRYAAAIEKQRAALGHLFREQDYVTPEQAAAAWSMDWNYVSFAAPERLETVDRALFEATQKKYEGRMAQAYEEVRLVLRETLLQLTTEIARKLEPGDDGKPKVFRNTVLDGLADFLGHFNLRDVTDDRQLAGVVKQLRKLTKGLDAERLRDMADVRAQVLGGLKAATEQLDGLVVTGRRAIRLDGGPLAAA